MVQISLKKMGCLAGFLVIVLLAYGVLTFTDVWHRGHVADDRMLPTPQDVAELRRLAPSGQVLLDSAQKAELREIYFDIVNAYSNRDVKLLCEWRRKLPEKVAMVAHSDYNAVEYPLDRIIHDDVYPSLSGRHGARCSVERYGSEDDFERAAASMLTLLGIYGDVHLRQRNFDIWFDRIEPLVVRWLMSCRDCFHAANRIDIEKVADRFLEEWIDQIESDNGYTKTLLLYRIAYARRWAERLMDVSGQTWEEIAQTTVRATTHGLIRAGYTPRWIDEFKVVPRHATPREETVGTCSR